MPFHRRSRDRLRVARGAAGRRSGTAAEAGWAKETAATNQQALRSYSWIEKTELLLNGEIKNTKVDSCRYGPDGAVVKTAVVEPQTAEKKPGLRGRIVEKKTGEMKEELESAIALSGRTSRPSLRRCRP